MISVITITHNRQEFLKKALASVLNQSFAELEYLVVDDGSADGTEELVKAQGDNRVRYFKQQHSGHLAALRNIGLDNARGEIIAFLDSDDFFEPAYLQKLKIVYAKATVQAVISNAHVLSESTKAVLFSPEFQPAANLLQQRLKGGFVIYPSCFSFRQIQPATRFDESMKYGDSDLFLRLLAKGNAVILKDALVNIVKHTANMSERVTNDPPFVHSYAEEFRTLKQLRENGQLSPWFYRKAVSTCAYKFGTALLQIKCSQDGRENFRKAFLSYPLNLKALFKLLFAA